MRVYVIRCEQTWRGELGPLVLGQLKDIEGPLEDLDPALHTGFLKRSDGVYGLDLMSAAKRKSTYVGLDLKFDPAYCFCQNHQLDHDDTHL